MYKVEKEFEYKGYKCVVVALSLGHRCGYVGVDQNNILYGESYDDEKVYDIEVHGGITYSDGGMNSEYPIKSDLWWLGFDCAHDGDARDLKLIKELNPDQATIDAFSMFNYGKVRRLDYCIEECKNMVEQIIKINQKNKKGRN